MVYIRKIGGESSRPIDGDRTSVRLVWPPHHVRGEVNYSASEIGRIARHHLIQGSDKLVVTTEGGRKLENE